MSTQGEEGVVPSRHERRIQAGAILAFSLVFAVVLGQFLVWLIGVASTSGAAELQMGVYLLGGMVVSLIGLYVLGTVALAVIPAFDTILEWADIGSE